MHKLANFGERITDYIIPRWRAPLNEHWLSKDDTLVLQIVLEERRRKDWPALVEQWAALGAYLVQSLILGRRRRGAHLEGLYPATDMALSWLRHTIEPESGAPLLTATLCALQAASDASCTSAIWSEFDPAMSDHAADLLPTAADLLLTGYDHDMASADWRATPFTRDAFVHSLELASIWTKAGDGWGYCVGATVQSRAYDQLLRRDAPRRRPSPRQRRPRRAEKDV